MKENFIDGEKLPDEKRRWFRFMFNFDMINGLLCILLSFFVPKIAFFLLFFKIPVWFFITVYIARQRRKDVMAKRYKKE